MKIGLVGLVILAVPGVGAGAQSSRTAMEGVYTDAQASRGQVLYKERCASCHGEALSGAQGPPLTGDAFLQQWGGAPLADLVNKIQNTMAANDPG